MGLEVFAVSVFEAVVRAAEPTTTALLADGLVDALAKAERVAVAETLASVDALITDDDAACAALTEISEELDAPVALFASSFAAAVPAVSEAFPPRARTTPSPMAAPITTTIPAATIALPRDEERGIAPSGRPDVGAGPNATFAAMVWASCPAGSITSGSVESDVGGAEDTRLDSGLLELEATSMGGAPTVSANALQSSSTD